MKFGIYLYFVVLSYSMAFGYEQSLAQNKVTLELLPKDLTDSTTYPIKSKIIFLAKITNNSKDTLCFYEEWNSWGFGNLDFDLKTVFGLHVKIHRISKGWDKNFPSYYLLKPNQSVVIPIYNHDGWWFWQNMNMVTLLKFGKLVAHYRQPSFDKVNGDLKTLPSGNENKIWMGSINSTPYNVRDIIK